MKVRACSWQFDHLSLHSHELLQLYATMQWLDYLGCFLRFLQFLSSVWLWSHSGQQSRGTIEAENFLNLISRFVHSYQRLTKPLVVCNHQLSLQVTCLDQLWWHGPISYLIPAPCGLAFYNYIQGCWKTVWTPPTSSHLRQNSRSQ